MALAGGVGCLPTRGNDLGIIQGNPIPAEAPSGCPQGRGELGFLFAKMPTVQPCCRSGESWGKTSLVPWGCRGACFPWGSLTPHPYGGDPGWGTSPAVLGLGLGTGGGISDAPWQPPS